MLGWLRGLRDPVIRFAHGSDRRAFVDVIGRADLIALSLPTDQGLDPETLTQEQLLTHIGAGVKDLAEREEFTLFTYPREGKRCLPLFSSHKLAEEFIHLYVREINRVLGFQVLTVRGRSLRDAMLSAEQVAVNARTQHERVLAEVDLRLVDELWG